MPIPKPKEGETQKDFIERCMGSEAMVSEYPKNDQRYAICMDSWRGKHEEKKDASPITESPQGVERRCYIADLIFRNQPDKAGVLTGYASVFNSRASWWGFDEMVLPGAFSQSIMADDIRALWNHDPNFVLGRNKAGTLQLWEDDHGLGVTIKPPDTQWARDLMTTINRGDVSQMSIGFEVQRQRIDFAEEEGKPDLRILQQVKLWDVSPVTYPFYIDTSIALRSIEAARTIDKRIASPILGLRRLRLRKRELEDYIRGGVTNERKD